MFILDEKEFSVRLNGRVIYERRERPLYLKRSKKESPGSNAGDRRQRFIFKASFPMMNLYGRKASILHMSYIQREGTGLDGEKPPLFGNTEAEAIVDIRKNEQRQFRFILSPENGHLVDMKKFTEEFIAKVIQEKGQPLLWAAVVHYNTAHPHSHIVIKGVDYHGKEVRFSKEQLIYGFRQMGRDMLTERLGFRVEQQQPDQSQKLGLTWMDRKLETLIGRRLEVNLKSLAYLYSETDLQAIHNRLAFLVKQGIVRINRGLYQFEEDWIRRLRDFDRCTEFKQIRNQAQYPERVKLYDQRRGDILAGRITYKGLANELHNSRAILVEGKTHSTIITGGKSFDHFKTGDLVRYNGRFLSRLPSRERDLDLSEEGHGYK